MLTARQRTLVAVSWEKVTERHLFARRFYDELFARFPELRGLFAKDIDSQLAKFVAMIDMIVQALQQNKQLETELRALGKRHAGYGVKVGDYAPVGEAFIATLEQSLGNKFDSDVKNAWSFAYQFIADEMLRGAEA